MLKAIHAQESREEADRKAQAIVEDLRAARMNTAAHLVERSVSETLTYYAFPDIHWRKIRTNNPLERIMKEIRRRTRVVGAFPDGQSCLNLAAARLRYIAGTAWLHEYAASLSAASHANRSRRLTKCAKDSGHYPKHRVEHAAMIAWRPAAAAMDQERFEVRPLIVGHQSANQGCPPQRAALNQFAILASIALSTRPSRRQPFTQ